MNKQQLNERQSKEQRPRKERHREGGKQMDRERAIEINK